MVSSIKEIQKPGKLLMTATSYVKVYYSTQNVVVDVWNVCPKSGNRLKKSDHENFAAVFDQTDGSNYPFTHLVLS